MLFKLLRQGRAFHGGDLAYSLPTATEPGQWHTAEGPLELCRNGFHLTDQPAHWWGDGCTVYVVEAEGVEGVPTDAEKRKVVARRVRLLREATEADLAVGLVFASGKHEVRAGFARAGGSAVVEAFGSAVVEAYGSAVVTAYGSAVVNAGGSAVVTAYDSAVVNAGGSARVTVKENAVCVDRRDGVRVFVAEGALVLEAELVALKKALAEKTAECEGLKGLVERIS